MKTELIPVEKIHASEDRENGGMGDLDGLAESMAMLGLINAITVRVVGSDYLVAAGRRRLSAAKKLGWATIRADVYEDSETVDIEQIQLAENVIRLDMHPLDEAKLMKTLLAQGVTVEMLSARYLRSKSAVYQRLQLNNLIEPVKKLYRDKCLSLVTASMIAPHSADVQEKIAARIQKEACVGEEIARFYLNSIISHEANMIVGRFFNSASCAECQQRTRYTDATLFPELNTSTDYCLNETCYKIEYQNSVIARVIALYQDAGVNISSVRDDCLPYLIEANRPPYALAGSSLKINKKSFSVVSSSEVYITDGEEESEYKDILHKGIKLYDEDDGPVSFCFYKDMPDDEDSEGEPTYEIPIASDDDDAKKAYKSVMENDSSIQLFAKMQQVKKVAPRFFAGDTPSEFKSLILIKTFSKTVWQDVCISHSPELDADIMQGGTKWLDRFTVEEFKQILFECLFFTIMNQGWYSLDRYQDTDPMYGLLNSLGVKGDAYWEKARALYTDEIARRVDELLDRPRESRAVSDNTFREVESEADETID